MTVSSSTLDTVAAGADDDDILLVFSTGSSMPERFECDIREIFLERGELVK